MEVDSIEQRPRQPAEITLPLSGRTHALRERRAASPARIGGSDELDVLLTGSGAADINRDERLVSSKEMVKKSDRINQINAAQLGGFLYEAGPAAEVDAVNGELMDVVHVQAGQVV